MSSCTFFGHRDYNGERDAELQKTILDLILCDHVDTFYVGNQGNFDKAVRRMLAKLSTQFSIQYHVVLAYLPTESSTSAVEDFRHTLLPENIEQSPPRFAIDRRNRWLIDHADIVVAYVTHSFGGAAKFVELAKRKKRTVILL